MKKGFLSILTLFILTMLFLVNIPTKNASAYTYYEGGFNLNQNFYWEKLSGGEDFDPIYDSHYRGYIHIGTDVLYEDFITGFYLPSYQRGSDGSCISMGTLHPTEYAYYDLDNFNPNVAGTYKFFAEGTDYEQCEYIAFSFEVLVMDVTFENDLEPFNSPQPLLPWQQTGSFLTNYTVETLKGDKDFFKIDNLKGNDRLILMFSEDVGIPHLYRRDEYGQIVEYKSDSRVVGRTRNNPIRYEYNLFEDEENPRYLYLRVDSINFSGTYEIGIKEGFINEYRYPVVYDNTVIKSEWDKQITISYTKYDLVAYNDLILGNIIILEEVTVNDIYFDNRESAKDFAYLLATSEDNQSYLYWREIVDDYLITITGEFVPGVGTISKIGDDLATWLSKTLKVDRVSIANSIIAAAESNEGKVFIRLSYSTHSNQILNVVQWDGENYFNLAYDNLLEPPVLAGL